MLFLRDIAMVGRIDFRSAVLAVLVLQMFLLLYRIHESHPKSFLKAFNPDLLQDKWEITAQKTKLYSSLEHSCLDEFEQICMKEQWFLGTTTLDNKGADSMATEPNYSSKIILAAFPISNQGSKDPKDLLEIILKALNLDLLRDNWEITAGKMKLFSSPEHLRLGEFEQICMKERWFLGIMTLDNKRADFKTTEPYYTSRIILPAFFVSNQGTKYVKDFLEIITLLIPASKYVSFCRAFIIFNNVRQQIYVHRKPKRSNSWCSYYPNSSACRQLLLMGGDISTNPGPQKSISKQHQNRITAAICPSCEKIVRSNHKRFLCHVCKDLTHARCTGLCNLSYVRAYKHEDWTCHKCIISVLLFMTVMIWTHLLRHFLMTTVYLHLTKFMKFLMKSLII